MATRVTPGARVGGFRIDTLVGRGAMGEVYRAHDANGRSAALKLLDPILAGDERFRRRFLRESELASHALQLGDRLLTPEMRKPCKSEGFPLAGL